eukprot:GHVL01037128.1.p1 GENE.GHVL01037128.1~~GHVL01037128.1.p1  ORF type:complete len:234 (-),score=41.00 GHVL01037128.1:245-946(-)
MFNTRRIFSKYRYYQNIQFCTKNTEKIEKIEKLSWQTRIGHGIFVSGFAIGSVILYDQINEYFWPKNIWNFNWDSDWKPISRIMPHENAPYLVSKNVLCIRHGQYKNPFNSSDDSEQGLTELGFAQADETGKRLSLILKDKKISGIYHSNLSRAKETAETIAKHFPGIPLTADPELAEGIPAYPEPPSRAYFPNPKDIETDAPRISGAFQKYFYCPDPPPIGTPKDLCCVYID